MEREMMSTFTIVRKIVFKGVLVLIGLVLFTVQLSDRFYFLANRPFIDIGARHGAHKAFFCTKPELSRECYFSPDKRYHFENGFTLFTPEPGQRNWLILSDQEFYVVNETAVWSTFPVISLRGPPVS